MSEERGANFRDLPEDIQREIEVGLDNPLIIVPRTGEVIFDGQHSHLPERPQPRLKNLIIALVFILAIFAAIVLLALLPGAPDHFMQN